MEIAVDLLETLQIKDREFVKRIYSDNLRKYEDRILALDFINADCVLDAGCGFGQWSMALAKYNKQVVAIELMPERIAFCKNFFAKNFLKNIDVQQGSIEKLPYEDSIFDIVWCYSVLYMTNWKTSLKELLRVLKVGGSLYVCTNDVGWYYNMIINEPNKTIDYNPRENAIQAFINEYRYKIAKENFTGERITRMKDIEQELNHLQVKIISLCGEGKSILNTSSILIECPPPPFFRDLYFDEIGVYEFVVAREA